MAKHNNKKYFAFLFIGILLIAAILVKKEQSSIPSHQKTKNQLHVFQKLPQMNLEDEAGSVVQLNQVMEGVSVLIYWASWCPHCVESLNNMQTLIQAVEAEGAHLIFINKLDGVKETKEQALQLLKQQNREEESYFDVDCIAYEEIGLGMIPTTIVVDNQQRITSVLEGSVPTSAQAKAMIVEAKQGKAVHMADAILETLVNEEGGMRTNYESVETTIPSGTDVLSESQGILMEYAAFSRNQNLFDRTWAFVKENLFAEGLMPWVVTDKSSVKVNALVDDLRILNALRIAENQWDGYGEYYESYKNAVYTYHLEKERLIDFYDVESKQKAKRFTLCYGDLRVLQELQKKDKRFRKLYDTTLETIQGGFISESFPLYYSYYDEEVQKYKGEEFHMAESLTTLLHLAEVDKLPVESMEWLEAKLEEGCIYSAYDLAGNPTSNGYYESTAVYAIAAMIALEEGREDLAGKAITRMEQFRIVDAENNLNGIFGGNDGQGIYSFDQGMALLAYEFYERKTE